MKRWIRALALVFPVVLLLTGCGSSGGAAPRDIAVTELTGSATVSHAEEALEVTPGLRLTFGDTIRLADEADIMLSIEEKKHLYADTGATFRVFPYGKKGKGRIRVYLSEGAVIAGQDNKPSRKDPFEVATPNVLITPLEKQTVYLVELGQKNGAPVTTVSVLNGSVRTGTTILNALSERELQAGAEQTFDGGLPDLKNGEDSEDMGQTEDTSGPLEIPDGADVTGLPEDTADKAAEIAEQTDAGESNEVPATEPEDRELIITKDGQSASLGKASDYTWGQRALVHIHNFFDRVGDRIDDVFTKRATERKIHGWLGLTSIPFTAGEETLGQDGSDNIVIDKPGVVCLGGLEVGDSEEDMWHFLGFHIDQKMAEKGVFVKNGNASLELSTGGFTYTKDGMVAKVVIKNGEVATIAMYFE